MLTIQKIATMSIAEVDDRLLELDILARADEEMLGRGLLTKAEMNQRNRAYQLERIVLEARVIQVQNKNLLSSTGMDSQEVFATLPDGEVL